MLGWLLIGHSRDANLTAGRPTTIVIPRIESEMACQELAGWISSTIGRRHGPVVEGK
jgi:hypothetical protein